MGGFYGYTRSVSMVNCMCSWLLTVNVRDYTVCFNDFTLSAFMVTRFVSIHTVSTRGYTLLISTVSLYVKYGYILSVSMVTYYQYMWLHCVTHGYILSVSMVTHYQYLWLHCVTHGYALSVSMVRHSIKLSVFWASIDTPLPCLYPWLLSTLLSTTQCGSLTLTADESHKTCCLLFGE